MDNEITLSHRIYVARKIFFLDDNNDPMKKISARVLQNLENRLIYLENMVKQLEQQNICLVNKINNS